MSSLRHADTKERTEKQKNHSGGMVEAGESITRRTTSARNRTRESCVVCLHNILVKECEECLF